MQQPENIHARKKTKKKISLGKGSLPHEQQYIKSFFPPKLSNSLVGSLLRPRRFPLRSRILGNFEKCPFVSTFPPKGAKRKKKTKRNKKGGKKSGKRDGRGEKKKGGIVRWTVREKKGNRNSFDSGVAAARKRKRISRPLLFSIPPQNRPLGRGGRERGGGEEEIVPSAISRAIGGKIAQFILHHKLAWNIHQKGVLKETNDG